MSYTFRSGPRDPNTGRTSTVIGSDNLIREPGTGKAAQPDRFGRVTGTTDREIDAFRPLPIPEGALTRDQYMDATGRTVTDPFGKTKGGIGRFFESANQRFGGSGLDYSDTIPLSQRQAIIDRAYDKYINPTDAQGNLRQFRPNELALLTDPATGARFPAIAQAVPRDLGPFALIPGAGLAQTLMGPKTELVPMEGSFTEDVMEEATNIQPTRPESTSIPTPPTGARRLISYNANQGAPSSLDPAFQNIPRDGIGNFVDKAIEGFKFGRGTFKPTFGLSPENKSFGLNYKIPLSISTAPSFPPNPATETDAERAARLNQMYGEQYERDRERDINRAMIDNYLEEQSDVGVFTPSNSDPLPLLGPEHYGLLLSNPEDLLPQRFGGLADPLLERKTLQEAMEDKRLQKMIDDQRTENSLFQQDINKFKSDLERTPNAFQTLSPRSVARQNLLSGRPFQET